MCLQEKQEILEVYPDLYRISGTETFVLIMCIILNVI